MDKIVWRPDEEKEARELISGGLTAQEVYIILLTNRVIPCEREIEVLKNRLATKTDN